MGRDAAVLLVIAGLGLVAVGFIAWTGALSWVGRLPGDIRYEGGNTRVYIPITTMILLSVMISAALYIARRFF